MTRYPFPEIPAGWYLVASSAEVPPGRALPAQVGDAALVCFRTESGEAVVADAHCPHLGAHLGWGGRVVGDTITCPFHGWRFDRSGPCVEVPYSPSRPRVGLRVRPSHEWMGLIFAFIGPTHAQPWDLRLPELAMPGGWRERHWRVRAHVQDMAENIPDVVHFRFVHHSATVPTVQVTIDGPRFGTIASMRQQTPRGEMNTQIISSGHGLAVWIIRFTGIVDTLLVQTMTPIGDGMVLARAFFHTPPDAGRLGDAMVENIARNIEDDIPIWENKAYHTKPVLVPEDGPIREFRRWVRQFYA